MLSRNGCHQPGCSEVAELLKGKPWRPIKRWATPRAFRPKSSTRWSDSCGGWRPDIPRVFGERDYKKHLNLAIVERAQGGIRSILDYVRREG